MFDKFIAELENAAKQKGFGEAETKELIEKYKRRYSLALEAGFSENEALEKFGSPENIVDEIEKSGKKFDECGSANDCGENKKAASGEKFESGDDFADFKTVLNRLFINNVSDKVDVYISRATAGGVKTVFEGNAGDYYKAEFNETNGYALEPKGENILKNSQANGSIYVLIGNNVAFKNIEINSACGGDVESSCDFCADKVDIDFIAGDATFGCISAKTCKISGVSGDFSCNKIKADSCNVSSVSGDFEIKEIIADVFDVNTVSGDVDVKNAKVKRSKLKSVTGDVSVEGEIDAYEASTVSGDIAVNATPACEKVTDKVGRSISTFFKSFGKKNDDKNND